MQLKSEYVMMPDGIRLAVDIWMPDPAIFPEPKPGVLSSTRYWRSEQLPDGALASARRMEEAVVFTDHGFVLVIADMRGSGASFGNRQGEWSQQEVEDIGNLVEWIALQDWCNGKVGAFGISYAANTAFHAAANCCPSLEVISPQFGDYDPYTQIMCPGGLPNAWLMGNWGAYTHALDRNDSDTVAQYLDPDNPEPDAPPGKGVSPVDGDDGSLLKEAVAQHADNANLLALKDSMTFRDDSITEDADTSLSGCCTVIGRSQVPVFYYAGWQDAGTSEGALNLFCSYSNPMRVRIGPWNHGMFNWHDPFDTAPPKALAVEDNIREVIDNIGPYLKEGAAGPPSRGRVLEYYTMGENRWKSTDTWPVAGTETQRLYLGAERCLQNTRPESADGCDSYQVDPEFTTGKSNRWHTQMGRSPVVFDDRSDDADKALVYTGAPLDADTEVTGRPAVALYVSSTAGDGYFLAYLQMVAPNGRVTTITEGYLRALHRKIEQNPAVKGVDYPHSFKRADGMPMIPGKIEEVRFSLYPTSILIPAGYSLRLTISCADKDTFELVDECANATISLMRNSSAASFLELPVVAGSAQ